MEIKEGIRYNSLSPEKRIRIIKHFYGIYQHLQGVISRKSREIIRFILEFYCKVPAFPETFPENGIVVIAMYIVFKKIEVEEELELLSRLEKFLKDKELFDFVDRFQNVYLENAISSQESATKRREKTLSKRKIIGK